MVVGDRAFEPRRVVEVAGGLDSGKRPKVVLTGAGKRSIVEDVLLLDVLFELVSPFFLFYFLDFCAKSVVDG